MKKGICLLLILLLCGCGYDKYQTPDGVEITLKDEQIEVYSDYYLHDLISKTNAEIISNNILINTDVVGTNTVEIEYKYQNKTYKYKANYVVVDTEKPIFISVSSTKTLEKGSKDTLCSSAVFADNYDRNPTCEIEGNYDLNKTGVYNVHYVIKDASHNEIRQSLKVNVVDKIKKTETKPSPKTNLYFADVLKKYKTDKTEVGIDVSRWQGTIDWQKVKEAGATFVMMRIGVQNDNDEELSMDSRFKENIKGAKEQGLKVGVYLYNTATSIEEAKEHARWVVEALDGEKLDFPIAYDWENWSQFKKYNINLNDLAEGFNAFYNEVKNYGYEAMIYGSKFYLENIWINKYERPVWLAHYTSKTSYAGDYILWQMSSIGKIDGIDADVDIDIYYKK